MHVSNLDVNAPAMAEFKSRIDTHQQSCAYITVGTGVGVGKSVCFSRM